MRKGLEMPIKVVIAIVLGLIGIMIVVGLLNSGKADLLAVGNQTRGGIL